VAVISAVLSLDEHLSHIIYFAGTVLSEISAAIALVFLQRCGASQVTKLSDAGHVSCRKHFLCPEILFYQLVYGTVVSFGTSSG
jgi:hypothetical protein